MASLQHAVTDGSWIAFSLAKVTAVLGYDKACRAFGRSRIPVSVSDLDAEAMTALLGKTVLSVSSDAEKAALSEKALLGAGGTGTSRSWLTLRLESGESMRVFVKLPASTVFESMFLTVFGVYDNECAFYERLLSDEFRGAFPEGIFSRVHVAEMARHRFVLVLEDLGGRPDGVFFPTVDSPHPADQVQRVLDAYAALHAAFWKRPPLGVWTDETSCRVVGGEPTRPPFLRVISDSTLDKVVKRWPDLLSPRVVETYELYLQNYDAVRRYWSSGDLCLVHGDSHLGNIFFNKATGEAGFYDLQCVAAEHPMRDVAYHLMLSCDSDDLASNEKAYVAHYVDRLNARRPDAITYDQAWDAYRLHALWALTALVISAGASEHYFAEGPATLTIRRVAVAMDRIDTKGALEDLLASSSAAAAAPPG